MLVRQELKPQVMVNRYPDGTTSKVFYRGHQMVIITLEQKEMTLVNSYVPPRSSEYVPAHVLNADLDSSGLDYIHMGDFNHNNTGSFFDPRGPLVPTLFSGNQLDKPRFIDYIMSNRQPYKRVTIPTSDHMMVVTKFCDYIKYERQFFKSK